MKWNRRGLIFDPTRICLPNGCLEYAQSPQALPLEEGVRVYFSTRTKDHLGKFLSHISYVEFDPTFSTIKAVAEHVVIPLGETGDFDEHGIFPIHIFRDGDEIWGYTTGWSRRASVSADASIGLAVSRNGGRTFRKIGKGPVLTSSLHEPFLIGDAFVLKTDGVYHMWYIFGLRWLRAAPDTPPDRIYKIGHASSQDGLNWEKEGRAIIADRLGEDECQALPSVLHFGGIYHMVFCYRKHTGFRTERSSAYRLGYAYSRDMKHWVRDDAALGLELSPDGWDSEMMCYPHLFAYADRICLLYNGNHFGKFGFGLAELES
ncbi:MAG: hypothetical protein NTW21_11900 [Verrucomicrobia bacterium]|nr:hypothetical protein [Verrucomicrobiota bacterium]